MSLKTARTLTVVYLALMTFFITWPGLLPFGKRLRPWYERKIEPWFRSRLND